MAKTYKITKYAIYTSSLSMSVVASLSPLLFLTFRKLYGISYSLLGALILINFLAQLLIDLLFALFSHRFNIEKVVKIAPLLTVVGLFVYAVFPFAFPNAVYAGLVIGTLIFSAAAGLGEALTSPVIAAIPAKDPEREVSLLHSVFAWGVVAVVIISALFLMFFGEEKWQTLVLLWIAIPLLSCLFFLKAELPPLKTPERASNVWKLIREKDFLIYFFCIFLGGASECIMSQWSSSYIERALNIPKIWGDIFGVAMFAVMLGLGRTFYSKMGKNIYKALIAGSLGAVVCYLAAAVSNISLPGLFACALTGLCVSMLWPGSLIIASVKFPSSGVAVFALMAAGGDLGAAVGPQLVGFVTDIAIKSSSVSAFAENLNISPEQFGMKAGLFLALFFPLIASILFIIAYKRKKASAME